MNQNEDRVEAPPAHVVIEDNLLILDERLFIMKVGSGFSFRLMGASMYYIFGVEKFKNLKISKTPMDWWMRGGLLGLGEKEYIKIDRKSKDQFELTINILSVDYVEVITAQEVTQVMEFFKQKSETE